MTYDFSPSMSQQLERVSQRISGFTYRKLSCIINITTDDYYCYYSYILYETFFLNL